MSSATPPETSPQPATTSSAEPTRPSDGEALQGSAPMDTPKAQSVPPVAAASDPEPSGDGSGRGVSSALVGVGLALLGLAALALAVSAWLKLNSLREDWGRRVADVAQLQRQDAQAIENLQTQTEQLLSLTRTQEARVAELAAQRLQLENVVKQLTQTQDQSLVQDVESSLRMATMQAEMVGHVRPLVAALQGALDRVARSDQIRTGALQVALEADLKAIQQTHVADVPQVLKVLSDAIQSVASMPLGVAGPSAMAPVTGGGGAGEVPPKAFDWRQLNSWVQAIQGALQGVLRIQSAPSASALTLQPQEAQYLRQQLQLRLLAVRVAVLNGRVELAREDLGAVIDGINQYAQLEQFAVQQVLAQLQSVRDALDQMAIPKPERSLRALAGVAK